MILYIFAEFFIGLFRNNHIAIWQVRAKFFATPSLTSSFSTRIPRF